MKDFVELQQEIKDRFMFCIDGAMFYSGKPPEIDISIFLCLQGPPEQQVNLDQ